MQVCTEMAARLMVAQDIHRAVVANHYGSIVSSLAADARPSRTPDNERPYDLRVEYVDLGGMPEINAGRQIEPEVPALLPAAEVRKFVLLHLVAKDALGRAEHPGGAGEIAG
jgi:hypothetical protein